MLAGVVLGLGFVTLISEATRVPVLVVSQEALEDDGNFTVEDEYGYVQKAFDKNGHEMSFEEIKSLKNDSRMDLEFVPETRK